MSSRPVLPPGAHVVRRDARTLLVGARPGVAVEDRPGLTEVLRLLDGRDVEAVAAVVRDRVPAFDADVAAVVRELAARGVLVEPPGPAPRLTVRVLAVDGAQQEAAVVDAAVEHVGLRESPDTSVLVLVSKGEPPRRRVRDAAGGTAVLPVVLEQQRARVGPLVVLGLTPCLDCFDAEQSRWDPSWRAVVAQLERPLVVAPPVRPDTGLLWRTAALVADELRSLAVRAEASSVGGVLTIDAGTDVARRPVDFAASCSCLP